jgi:hypothetical protein
MININVIFHYECHSNVYLVKCHLLLLISNDGVSKMNGTLYLTLIALMITLTRLINVKVLWKNNL